MCHKFITRSLLALVLWLAGSLVAGAITVADLQKQLANGGKLTIIDVRAPALFAQSHIPGAINIPASLCPYKRLPSLGQVIVCGDGLGGDATLSSAKALSAKPGITADILEGGFAAWESAGAPGTKTPGLKPEALNYISYGELKGATASEVLLVDLRSYPASKAAAAANTTAPSAKAALTDLAQEFPGMRVTQMEAAGASLKRSAAAGSRALPLLVLIDNGDGTAEVMARRLKASGDRRYAILAGGELVLSRNGQSGLQRSGSRATLGPRGAVGLGATP